MAVAIQFLCIAVRVAPDVVCRYAVNTNVALYS